MTDRVAFGSPVFTSQAASPVIPLCNELFSEVACRGAATGMLFQNAAQQGRCARAYMDVYTAILKQHTGGCGVRRYNS